MILLFVVLFLCKLRFPNGTPISTILIIFQLNTLTYRVKQVFGLAWNQRGPFDESAMPAQYMAQESIFGSCESWTLTKSAAPSALRIIQSS